jgi:hypothetical protein
VHLRTLRNTAELENHLGIGDKTLAEFIISLAEGHATPVAFHAALVANGAELPLDFCATLLNVILRLKPGKAGAKAAGGGGAGGASGSAPRPDVKYPALAVPDSRERASELNKELLGGRNPMANAACVPRRAWHECAAAAALPECGRALRCVRGGARHACDCADATLCRGGAQRRPSLFGGAAAGARRQARASHTPRARRPRKP